MYTKSFLICLRRKAYRAGRWFKALDRFDRSFYNLICSVVDRVWSPVLGKEILCLVLKVRDALKSEFVRWIESVGIRKAWEAASQAVAWSYRDASVWKHNSGFARFHAMMEINNLSRGVSSARAGA